MFTPQPGTGCLTQNPNFVNPNSSNFNIQSNSPCCCAGLDGYDIGAMFHQNIPEAPPYFAITNIENSEQIKINWINPTKTVHGTLLDTLSSIQLWRNDSLIADLSMGYTLDTLEYTDTMPRPDYYRYQICAVDTMANRGRRLYSNEQWYGGPAEGLVIWEMDPTPITGTALQVAIKELGYSSQKIYISQNSSKYPLNPGVDAVFVCLGIYPNNHVLGNDEALLLKNYLDSGGNVYMEGGDTWCYDPQTFVHPYFNINPISDGVGDLYHVQGQSGTVYENINFVYSGENSFIDHIEPLGMSQRIFFNPSSLNGVGIAYNADLYKTIGTSFELGGLVDASSPSTKKELVDKIFNFFGIVITDIPTTTSNNLIPNDFTLNQNYPNPFNLSTVFKIGLPSSGRVTLNIYSITGQRVFSKNLGEYLAGWHEFQWNGSNNQNNTIASGIYFYQFIFHGKNSEQLIKTGKMHLIK